jgi:hypothetical protein
MKMFMNKEGIFPLLKISMIFEAVSKARKPGNHLSHDPAPAYNPLLARHLSYSLCMDELLPGMLRIE